MGKIMKKVMAGVMAAVFAVGFALPASAEVTLEDLAKRIDALEQENASLKAEVAGLKGQQASQAKQISEVSQKATSAVATAVAPSGNFLGTKFKTTLYGYVKVDAVYSDSSSGGVLTMYPVSEPTTSTGTHNDDSFNMTANETRIGLDFSGLDLEDGGKASAKIETDFWGGTLRVRQAFAKIAYEKWDVLAGQTWDLFSPLGPSSLNFGYGWNSGNIGDRHVQLILSNKISDDILGGKLSTKVGILDTNVSNQTTTGAPVATGLINLETKLLDMPTTVYLGGAYGGVESDTYDERLWALTSGVTMKITDKVSMKAEGYQGSVLNAFRSAGFDTDGIQGTTGIDSRGGFVELTVKPTAKLESNTGVGIDNVTTTLTSASTSWKRNEMFYSNLKYSLTKDLLVGLEIQQFAAKFANDTKGTDNRVQTSIVYKF